MYTCCHPSKSLLSNGGCAVMPMCLCSCQLVPSSLLGLPFLLDSSRILTPVYEGEGQRLLVMHNIQDTAIVVALGGRPPDIAPYCDGGDG